MSKVILITGGGSGLGQALAWLCAENNYKIYIVGRRKESLLQTQSKYLDNIHCIKADITQAEQRKHLLTQIHESKLDYVVHNAGKVDPVMDLADISEEDFSAMMNINLFAPIFLTQDLKAKFDSTRILQISSGLAHQAVKGVGTYSISKAGLYMAKEVFNKEFCSEQAIFGSVKPGIVKTAMSEQLFSDSFGNSELFKTIHEKNQFITPKIAAKFLFFILSKTTSEDFMENEWDIYQEQHHEQWLGDDKIVFPFQ